MKRRTIVTFGVIIIIVVACIVGLFVWKSDPTSSDKEPRKFKMAIVTWVGFAPFYIAKTKDSSKRRDWMLKSYGLTILAHAEVPCLAANLMVRWKTVDSLAIGLSENLPAVEVLQIDESYGGDGLLQQTIYKTSRI